MKQTITLAILTFASSQTLAGGTWTAEAPMPTPRFGPGVGVINGKLYVASGCCMSDNVTRFSVLEVYDPSANVWSAKAPIPIAIYDGASGVINGKLYVAGGGNDLSNTYNLFDSYDPVANTWTSQTPMPTARSEPGSGVINGIFYVVGGAASATSSSIPVGNNEAFSIAPVLPTAVDQCKNNGWQMFGVFKNQGDCVSFVATKGKNN